MFTFTMPTLPLKRMPYDPPKRSKTVPLAELVYLWALNRLGLL